MTDYREFEDPSGPGDMYVRREAARGAFYASGLIAAGSDVVTVQRALGHRSATVTLNTYGHL
jgi:integrase